MKDFNEGFTRLSKASTGVADRVPFTTQMHEFAMTWCDVPSTRFYSDANILVSGILKTAEDFEFDIPSLGYDVYSIEAEAMGQPLVYSEKQAPLVDKEKILIRDENDLTRLESPHPPTSGRMPFVLDLHRIYTERVGTVPGIQFTAPFTLATLVRGYTNFIQDIYTNPEFARHILDFLTEEVIAPWINAQKDDLPGAQSAVGADALCSPPMVNPEIIVKFSIPYILRLRELCRGIKVAVVNWWGDSYFERVEEFLKLKQRVAVGLIRAQDPDVAKVGPRVFKEFTLKNDLTLELGVGDVILNQGPEEKIRERIRSYISQTSEGGRLIIYLSSLNGDTPARHVKTAVEAIKEYGEYREMIR